MAIMIKNESLGDTGTVGLRHFNTLDRDAAERLVWPCLGVDRWARAVAARRPYADLDHLFAVARGEAELVGDELAAAVAHRAGRPDELLVDSGAARTGCRDRAEIDRLRSGATLYATTFGRPFLIRRSGRTVAQMLSCLQTRLRHDAATEDRVVAQELRQLALLDLAARVSVRAETTNSAVLGHHHR